MKKLYQISAAIVACLISIATMAQSISGDVKFWNQSDLLGFDKIDDCRGTTGDISSAYARIQDNTLMLRVTFDDMVTRKGNKVEKDHFRDKDIKLQLEISRHGQAINLQEKAIDLSLLQSSQTKSHYLRTPQANLWEASINYSADVPIDDLRFSLFVKIDGKTVDQFVSNGRDPDATGNCAFVHHGNQGITYTEVFYGSPNGQSGLEGSGFDEILQVHEATDIPGNFHMSGTLMPAAEWHNPEFNDWLYNLASEGLAEMMTSALGQHIMPFLQNDMNNWSVGIESDMVDFQYNYTPTTAWVPERVWLTPDVYPNAGVIDWLGDNWAQHGVWGVVLDDSPHLNGYDNRKIHWMNNGSGIDLRVIPINNSFVGNMQNNADAAKNQIAGMGEYNICVYGTDWEVAAEMNEHDGTFYLDNYESVLWWCHDNYPGVNVWKMSDAMQNSNFNGTGADITPGTYNLLGGADGYGGSNNSWYTQWAATPSHSDFHDPQWTYGYVWDDAHNNLLTAPDNNLSQLAWYIMMINLHETGWHDGGEVAGWEHRYSSHIKNANVYAHAARWADGQYQEDLAAYYDDIDHDGVDEVVIHNQDIFAVFESIGGKVNWLFYKDNSGNAHSVVGSDMAYWSETDGDYNESSNNHVAALSDVYPYQQDAIYDIDIIQSSGDTVIVELSQWGVKKRIELTGGNNYLDVTYDFYDSDGYVKSGWSPGLMDLVWSGKSHVQRMWGDYGSYCGQRNSSSGATVALVLGNGGAQHNTQFEGTLVMGDEINGYNRFLTRLYAGYTSEPSGTTVPELNDLAGQNMDIFPPTMNDQAFQIDNNTVEITFSEAVEITSAENIANYTLQGFSGNYTLESAQRQDDWRKVHLTIAENWQPGDEGEIIVENVEDLNGNVIEDENSSAFTIPSGVTPHTINIDGTNDFDPETELMVTNDYTLYITWDNEKIYLGFESLNLSGGGDLFVNLDTDQTAGSGAPEGSWGRVVYPEDFMAEYQVAIEGGGGSIQLNNYTGGQWNYPGSNGAESYEGWEENGLTEIAVPWESLNNPQGIALSVHVSEEDNQMITAAYPGENPTGDHPTLTHVYAYYQPYIPSGMPLAGMEPNTAVIVPEPQGDTQEISLTSGYQFISSYIQPGDPEMTVVVESLMNNETLDFIRNSNGSLLHKIGPVWVNNIGDWNTTEGYLFRMYEVDNFTISGTTMDPHTPIDLGDGYQFISYLPASPMDAQVAVASILDNLDFIRNSDGAMLRKIGPNWINDIGNMMPGEGYLARMNDADELVYPVSGKKLTNHHKPKPQYFKFSGGNPADPVYTLYLEASQGIEAGDEVGAFQDGKLLGSTFINKEGPFSNSLAVFKTLDDQQGYRTGKPIKLKLYDKSANKERNLTVDFANPYGDAHTSITAPAGDGKYSIARITKQNKGFVRSAGFIFYPNPAKDIVHIHARSSIKRISLMNYTGQAVLQNSFNDHNIELDISMVEPGLYVLEVDMEAGIKSEKIIIK
ncbi:MAG: T9SS type A sorting domain-containing protein [Bacteroidales bacterium]|nr:T9SS type A sorting domain-containing protein [Bacteroidales bacterium]